MGELVRKMLVGVEIIAGVEIISMSVGVGIGVVGGEPCNDVGFGVELNKDVILVVSTGSTNGEVNATGVDIGSITTATDVVNTPLGIDGVSDTSVVAEDDFAVGSGNCTAQTNTLR